MSFSAELYSDRRTWLHAADPRVKLAFVAASMVLLLRFRNLPLLLAGLALILLLHAAARTPTRQLAAVGWALLPTNLFIALAWIVFYPSGEPVFQLWLLKITPASVAQGLALALRIDALSLAVFLWLCTTEAAALVRGLVKLGLPYEWGLTLSLALRYIPAFGRLYRQIADAQQARGLNFEQGSGFRRVRLMMPVFVAMMIAALRSSEQLARALEARATGARGLPRTYLHDLSLRVTDYLLLALVLLLFAVLLALNLWLGFGAAPLAFWG